VHSHRATGNGIGFVPTMGALHEGHITLVNKARTENSLVIVSIFVNPTQFHNPNDLINYPRTPEKDHEMLGFTGCDLLFEPSVEEVYPGKSVSVDIDFGDLERVMEGKYRPGHFKGVATVVTRLFEIVQPDRAYFGEKDFQQLAIIRELNNQLRLGIKIIGCPTLREPDGLAMSSRNVHLDATERAAAPVIYRALCLAVNTIAVTGPDKTRDAAIGMIEQFPGFKVEYLEFVDSATLQPISVYDSSRNQRACIAVRTKSTRLIDNVAL
jgi:pantoate--beta-alanine ligase